jgi:hypothetical protein
VTSDGRRDRRRENIKEFSALGGLVAGGIYGRGLGQSISSARRLSRLAKPGMIERIHAPGVSFSTDREAYRTMAPSVDRWVNTYRGARVIRRDAQRGVSPVHHLLHPYRTRNALDYRALRTATDTAPKRPFMYRGMALAPGESARPFDEIASWSPSSGVAQGYARSAVWHASQKSPIQQLDRGVKRGQTEPRVVVARGQRGFALGPFSVRQGSVDPTHEYLARPGTRFTESRGIGGAFNALDFLEKSEQRSGPVWEHGADREGAEMATLAELGEVSKGAVLRNLYDPLGVRRYGRAKQSLATAQGNWTRTRKTVPPDMSVKRAGDKYLHDVDVFGGTPYPKNPSLNKPMKRYNHRLRTMEGSQRELIDTMRLNGGLGDAVTNQGNELFDARRAMMIRSGAAGGAVVVGGAGTAGAVHHRRRR